LPAPEAALMLFIALIVMWLGSKLSSHAVLARVKVPGSNLIVMLYQDDQGKHRYDVLADFKKEAIGVVLGSSGALTAEPQVAILGDRVTITFHTDNNTAPFIELDLKECRIVQHSNTSDPPPFIDHCKRK